MLLHSDLTEKIIGAAMEVHRLLGPGLLESAYAECLRHELDLRGIRWQKEVSVEVNYKGLIVDNAYRIDLIVEGVAVVELKAVEQLLPVHDAQLLTYLKLTGKRVGLLINFCVPALENGIGRRVL